MSKKFVALSPVNVDYMFKQSGAFYVNPKKAAYVAEVLNKEHFNTLPGHIWKVFTDNGQFTARILYTSRITKNRISLYEIQYLTAHNLQKRAKK